MKILILAARGERATDNEDEPLWFAEVRGVPFIELLFKKTSGVRGARTVVALSAAQSERHRLVDVVSLLNPGATVLSIEHPTMGATCTALLAIDHINSEEELLIINGDELLDIDFEVTVSDFRNRGWSAGTLYFSSIQPRYSFIRVTPDHLVTEAAEKRPISRNATAGFYWFLHGSDFVRAAMDQIRNNDLVDGHFYVCPSLNELILRELPVGALEIQAEKYHPLKTARQVGQLESNLDLKVSS